MENIKQNQVDQETFLSRTTYSLEQLNDSLDLMQRRLNKMSLSAGTIIMKPVSIDDCAESPEATNHIEKIGNIMFQIKEQMNEINNRISELENFI